MKQKDVIEKLKPMIDYSIKTAEGKTAKASINLQLVAESGYEQQAEHPKMNLFKWFLIQSILESNLGDE